MLSIRIVSLPSLHANSEILKPYSVLLPSHANEYVFTLVFVEAYAERLPDTELSLSSVRYPARPSAVSLFADWNFLTAAVVCAP